MYFRLQGALPDLIVLSQVSFGALLSARSRAVRNTFDRKRADFVICEKSFKVVAIIELDDSSHDGKKAFDEKRDAQLKAAGYRVLRYRGIPNIDQVQADFAPPPTPLPRATTRGLESIPREFSRRVENAARCSKAFEMAIPCAEAALLRRADVQTRLDGMARASRSALEPAKISNQRRSAMGRLRPRTIIDADVRKAAPEILRLHFSDVLTLRWSRGGHVYMHGEVVV
jgi:hypothetical protein